MAKLAGSAQVLVQAPPETVYGIVTDVTRVSQWSPECYQCAWLDGAAGPAVGARFRGRNRRGWLRWVTTCRVSHLENNRVFGFEVVQPVFGVQTRWRYDIEPAPGGALLRERFEVLWLFPGVTRFLFGGKASRQAQLEDNVRQTLARIKAIAEGG